MRRGNASQAVASLKGLERTLERLAYVPRNVAVIASPKLTALVQAQFRAGTDPYGRPWRPLRPSTIATGRHNPPLTATAKLRDGTKARPRPGGRAGIEFRIGTRYGRFHQTGFRVRKTFVAPRRILPQHGIPQAWSRVLHDATRQAIREASRG
jgi:hypothetical protein